MTDTPTEFLESGMLPGSRVFANVFAGLMFSFSMLALWSGWLIQRDLAGLLFSLLCLAIAALAFAHQFVVYVRWNATEISAPRLFAGRCNIRWSDITEVGAGRSVKFIRDNAGNEISWAYVRNEATFVATFQDRRPDIFAGSSHYWPVRRND